jgi:DAK2 domain fusion protein YloV
MESPSGDELRKAFVAATDYLERYRDAINSLNVFPVPDGDTGTNMLLTMRSALERCPNTPHSSAEDVLSGLAEGAFWGARGNSGVILSQLFRGLSDASKDTQDDPNPWLVRGLRLATEAAYKSVVKPVEGTMLSVIKASSYETAWMAEQHLSGKQVHSGPDEKADQAPELAPNLWETAFDAAVEALYATPSQLPILREAGVVDAGGMGVTVILGAAFCSLTGRDPKLVDQAIQSCCVEPVDIKASQHGELKGLDSIFLDTGLGDDWGYCIQYVIDATDSESTLSAETVRDGLGPELSGSAVVISDGQYLKLHVHASDPGPALSYGASLGSLDRISVENMSIQNSHFVAGHRANTNNGARLAVVAVVQGKGLANLFLDSGGSGVIDGGQTMNPSVGQIVEKAAAIGAAYVILLPNNSNVLAAANQAAAQDPRLHVVPSVSVPQGVAALLAFNPEETLEHNLEAMSVVLDTVTSLEVTQAVRDTSLGGKSVNAGQYIGLLQGEIKATGETPEGALMAIFNGIVTSADQIVTIFRGIDATPGASQYVQAELVDRFPGIQVDLIDGGQPHYHYLASVE